MVSLAEALVMRRSMTYVATECVARDAKPAKGPSAESGSEERPHYRPIGPVICAEVEFVNIGQQ
jgi:hypothetical protein